MATIGNVTIRIGATAKQLEYDLKRAENALKRSVSNMQGLGNRLSLGVTLPLGLAGASAFKMASDVEESLNKVRVAFGQSSGEVEKFADTTLESFGIARGSALDMSALFGDMATSMGLPQSEAAKLSTSLVGLAGDLASFKNISLSEVQTALSGIFTGETESLKRLGIVMLEANLQAYALEQGITKSYKSMTQAEKVALRYQYILTQTKNAQGDFARTSDGAANQMRIFQESLKELGASLGQVLLPVITPIIQKLNEWLKAFKELSPETKKTIVVVAALAAALGPALTIFAQMYSAIGKIQIAFTLLRSGLAAGKFVALLNPIGLSVAAIGAAVYVIAKNWDEVSRKLKIAANFFIDLYNNSIAVRGVVEGISFVFKSFIDYLGLLGRLFEDLITLDFSGMRRSFDNFMDKTLANAKKAIIQTFAPEPVEKFDTAIKNTFKDLTKLKGFENVLNVKPIVNTEPIGVLAPQSTTFEANITGGAKVKDLNEQIKDLKENIDKLSIAYSKKPSAGLLDQLNKQIDQLKAKESILKNAEALTERLLNGQSGTIEVLPKLNFSGALQTLKDFATRTSETIRTETKKGLLDGLTVEYSESGFSQFFSDLRKDLSNTQRQFDDGIISGLEKNAQQFDTLKGKLTELGKNGFGKLSPEVLAVKSELDKLGGFAGFSSLVQGVDKVVGALGAVSGVVNGVIGAFQGLFDNQIANIDARQQKEIEAINNSALNEEQKAKRISEAEKKYDKERRAIQRKQAIANKASSIFSATVSMFQGIASALALGPVGLPLLPLIKALGLANIAAIAAAPIPALAIGTDYVKNDGMAYLHKGEAVVPADVAGGGFSRQNGQLYSVVRGNDLWLISERNKALAQRLR